MIYFISDEHYLHSNILRLDSRPFKDMDDMIRTMIAKHNSRVRKTDICYHLGDYAFGNPKRWLPIIEQCQGRHMLIRGNHDLQNGATLKRLIVDGNPLFEDMGDIEQFYLDGVPIVLSHYPYEQLYDQGRLLHMRPKDNGRWLLHGHTHKPPVVNDRMINVGCMLHDYYPVSQKEIASMIKLLTTQPQLCTLMQADPKAVQEDKTTEKENV